MGFGFWEAGEEKQLDGGRMKITYIVFLIGAALVTWNLPLVIGIIDRETLELGHYLFYICGMLYMGLAGLGKIYLDRLSRDPSKK